MRLALPVVVAALSLGCYGGDPGDEGASETTGSGTSAGPTADPSGDESSAPTTSGATTVTSQTTQTSQTSQTTQTSATDETSIGTGDSASTTIDPSTGGDSTTTGEPPEEPAVHYVGRYDASDPNHVRMGWSGVGAVIRFDGTGARVKLDDNAKYFTVVVDGAVQPQPLATSPGEQTYPLAEGLPAGEHTVELYRRTEGNFGPTAITGVEIDGELLAPPPVTRRIEIIGDSITCGYGNEGVAPCSFSAETENHYLTYGAVTARALGAELSTVAWSGKGVIYNYDKNVDQPMPEIYDRLLASDGAPWSFAWQPDVVVINLGTNDFSTDGDPPEDVFVSAYVAFLTHLREVYPDAHIQVVSPSLWGAEADMVDGYLQSVVEQRHGDGDLAVAWANVNVDWIGSGCDGHPSVATHAGMAAELTAVLQAELGW